MNSPHSSDLDGKLRQLVHEMTDAAPPAGPPPMVAPVTELGECRSRPTAAWVAAAAIVVLVVGGMAWRLAGSDSGSSRTDVAGGVPADGDLPVPTGSLADLGPDDWPFPTYLPEGMTLQETVVPHFGSKALVFKGDGGTPVLTVQVDSIGPEDLSSLPVSGMMNGVLWVWAGDTTLAADLGDAWIWVMSGGLDRQTLLAVAESLVPADAAGVPLNPLDPATADYVRAAELLEHGVVTVLFVATNGDGYATRIDAENGFGSESCCGSLGRDELLSIYGWSSGMPTPEGEVAVGLLDGIVDERVALIEIHLFDGSLITTEPQDLDDAFPINFLFVTVPSTSPPNVIDAIVVFDADGNELGRMNEGIGVIREGGDVSAGDEVAGISTVTVESGSASDAGTADVVFEFDGALPGTTARHVEEISYRESNELTFTTQRSDDMTEDIMVCGNTHQFPPPGIRTVDLLIPREWFAADYVPVDSPAGGPQGLAKIVICEPVDDIVQLSIWGAASAEPEDVEVTIGGRFVRVEISSTPES